MLISVKHNFVFFCTPKCASVSSESMLEPFSDISLLGLPTFRHTKFIEYDQFIRPYIENKTGINTLETICLIREPLSWLNSWYRFRSRSALANPGHPQHKNSTLGIQFSDFIEEYMTQSPADYANVHTQFDIVKDSENKPGIDKMFLYENIEDFVKYMSTKVAKDLKLKNKNLSPGKIYKFALKPFTESLSQKVRDISTDAPTSLPPYKKFDISEDLYKSLKQFISNDFELYEFIKNDSL